MPRLLFLCWGNICRSTMAEQVLRAAVAEAGLPVEVDSAGTSREEIGNPIDPRAATTLAGAGYEVGAHRARQVTAAEVEQTELVVAMEPLHVDRLAGILTGSGLDPATVDTLLRDRVALLTDFDPAAPPGSGVPDPWYGPDSAFDETLAAIEAAVPGILDRLREGGQPRNETAD